VVIPRLPYAVDPSMELLARFDRIVLVGAKAPVAFFAYPNKPGYLAPSSCQVVEVATAEHDAEAALRCLCEAVGGTALMPKGVADRTEITLPEGALDPDGIGRLLAALIPENAIVVDEAISTGRKFDIATQGAAPHDWLTGMGGAIGFGLPAAVGAAISAPDRRVIALEGDGSGMYTLQSLWSMVRESLKVTVVIFANRSYKILHGEFAQVGAGAPGHRATDMLTLDRPVLDWCALANGMGVEATRAMNLQDLGRQLRRSLASDGPSLIEVVL
jgi:acetolactate synthase-1/2/3 large subunit